MPPKPVSLELPVRRSPGWFLLLLAVALGLGGAWYSRHYIEARVQQYRSELEQPVEQVEVLVAAVDLQHGDIPYEDHFASRALPLEHVDPMAISALEFERWLGRPLASDVRAGSPLLPLHFDQRVTERFSGRLAAGRRALTILVDEVNSISGFLQPEDRIDLWLSHGHGDSRRIELLLENIRVLATGQQVDGGLGENNGLFGTITLDVSPTDGRRITLAQQLGKLTAMLRAPEDEQRASLSALDADALFGRDNKRRVSVPATVATEPPRSRVQFIIGGQ